MIDISQITYSYGRRKAPVFADFSLSLAPGHVYGLLGKNGTGKSTLLYLMCGLLRAQSGSIQFEGIDVRKRLPEVLREVFLVSEEFDLPNVSLERYVHMNAPFIHVLTSAFCAIVWRCSDSRPTLASLRCPWGRRKRYL